MQSLKTTLQFAALASLALVSGCAQSNSTRLASRSIEAYCPHLPSLTFSNPVMIAGKAVYEYRVQGNQEPSDSGTMLAVEAPSVATPPSIIAYRLEIDGQEVSVSSGLTGISATRDVVAKLKATIHSQSSGSLFVYGLSTLTITRPGSSTAPVITLPADSNLRILQTNADPKPIRKAEIAVKNNSGAIIQCAETEDDGSFSFQIPKDSGSYSLEIRARANNSRSTAYVLNNPTSNKAHALEMAIDSDADQNDLYLRARVHEDKLLGGAFNILDQLLRAQDYLRSTTEGCNQVGHVNYHEGCSPFTRAPLVKVYWSPGVSPAGYVGTTGPISYYLNGRQELFLQGGMNGNVISSDMDHFDNSVILHEYAHFLEDAFGKPNSPGGTHSGDSIIDPRLAWGEGWATFFQAAVTGDPVYRDTYGTPDCSSSCLGSYFNESLNRAGGAPHGIPSGDIPTLGSLGEGNFREFSVARMLWEVVKPSGGVGSFAEIWRAFTAPGLGMQAVNDPFKSIGRFHHIQTTFRDLASWSEPRLEEEQSVGFTHYATPIELTLGACPSSPISISPVRSFGDNGSFATSDLYRSNHFFRYDHTGGQIFAELFYNKNESNSTDLDLYIYRTRYVFGKSSDILLASGFQGDGCPLRGSSSDLAN
ncbi:MAG: hypothetical protein RBT63_02580, partial [Bdellovibrionales bacterium]|nr:hypothetical protein [Bdellovibrionales bacterium]